MDLRYDGNKDHITIFTGCFYSKNFHFYGHRLLSFVSTRRWLLHFSQVTEVLLRAQTSKGGGSQRAGGSER